MLANVQMENIQIPKSQLKIQQMSFSKSNAFIMWFDYVCLRINKAIIFYLFKIIDQIIF